MLLLYRMVGVTQPKRDADRVHGLSQMNEGWVVGRMAQSVWAACVSSFSFRFRLCVSLCGAFTCLLSRVHAGAQSLWRGSWLVPFWLVMASLFFCLLVCAWRPLAGLQHVSMSQACA